MVADSGVDDDCDPGLVFDFAFDVLLTGIRTSVVLDFLVCVSGDRLLSGVSAELVGGPPPCFLDVGADEGGLPGVEGEGGTEGELIFECGIGVKVGVAGVDSGGGPPG